MGGSGKIPWCLCGKGTLGKGWGVAAPDPRDWVGLSGAGVPFPRALSAKQRSLDPSPLELGTQGPCWSMARGQSPGRGEVAQDEGGGDSARAPSRPTMTSSTPTMAPVMGQRGCSRGCSLRPPEDTARHREAGCPGALLGPGQMLSSWGGPSWPERKSGPGCLARGAEAEPREGR